MLIMIATYSKDAWDILKGEKWEILPELLRSAKIDISTPLDAQKNCLVTCSSFGRR